MFNVEDENLFLLIIENFRLRSSTHSRLKNIASNETALSLLLDKRLSSDPIYPILTNDHLHALDRRLLIVLKTFENCFNEKKKENVLIEDNY